MAQLITKYQIFMFTDSPAERGGANNPRFEPIEVTLEFDAHEDALGWAEHVLEGRGNFIILPLYRVI